MHFNSFTEVIQRKITLKPENVSFDILPTSDKYICRCRKEEMLLYNSSFFLLAECLRKKKKIMQKGIKLVCTERVGGPE